MSDFLTIFTRPENFEIQPDFSEKIGNLGLGLLMLGFGRRVKIEKLPNGYNFIDVNNSIIKLIVQKALIIFPMITIIFSVRVTTFLLKTTVLLSGVGFIASICSTSRKELLRLYKKGNNNPIARADRITKIALSYLLVKELYEQASMTAGYKGEIGNYKIEFVSKTHAGFDSTCIFGKRTIDISDTLSDKVALTMLIFELINATTYTKFFLAQNKFLLSKDVSEYAKECERIEFENTIEHNNIIKKSGLGSDYLRWKGRKSEDFEKAWVDYIATSEHAEYWRSRGKYTLSIISP